ncbi:hypothetical protein PTSG_06557 [Salpingoeca rosetta]|uniref:Uncharacterized protein n=1 Tax=Salpingoeca rosetta (strain ATCC 50818 / BSB-021) TaxID=946362 RepID=F2UG55_SALR5|nr:uncharacterized protein PTSG_06557 [Salpingoeca rosetta]EGD75483.1 hypothetical protein PTSG_06557 [Salpingoeca rosetta]|eukprot:XP_004991940.1 hypothetical protein PTSG_06557 [Salpingoeca rosetta]
MALPGYRSPPMKRVHFNDNVQINVISPRGLGHSTTDFRKSLRASKGAVQPAGVKRREGSSSTAPRRALADVSNVRQPSARPFAFQRVKIKQRKQGNSRGPVPRVQTGTQASKPHPRQFTMASSRMLVYSKDKGNADTTVATKAPKASASEPSSASGSKPGMPWSKGSRWGERVVQRVRRRQSQQVQGEQPLPLDDSNKENESPAAAAQHGSSTAAPAPTEAREARRRSKRPWNSKSSHTSKSSPPTRVNNRSQKEEDKEEKEEKEDKEEKEKEQEEEKEDKEEEEKEEEEDKEEKEKEQEEEKEEKRDQRQQGGESSRRSAPTSTTEDDSADVDVLVLAPADSVIDRHTRAARAAAKAGVSSTARGQRRKGGRHGRRIRPHQVCCLLD